MTGGCVTARNERRGAYTVGVSHEPSTPARNFLRARYGISWLLWAPLWLPALGIDGLPVLPSSTPWVPGTDRRGVPGVGDGERPAGRDLMRRMILGAGACLGGGRTAGPDGILVLAVGAAGVLQVYRGGRPATAEFGGSREFPQFSALGFIAYNIVSFGFGEEVGWRGFAFPRLQSRHSALVATLRLTVGWALWHLPLFFYRPGYTSMGAAGVVGWFFSLLTGAVLLTWLYNESRGSILVVALFHAAVDVAFTSSVSSPFVVDATGALITLWGIAVLIIAGPRYLGTSCAAKPRRGAGSTGGA